MNRKDDHHKAVRARAERALQNLYHNATPTYPRELYGRTEEYFEAWFQHAAEFEIDYLRDGGAYGKNYAQTLRAPCNAGKFKSQAARDYYVRKGMRERDSERADCGALTGWRTLELAVRKAQGKSQSALWHRWFKGYSAIPVRAETKRNNAMWEYISEYGTLYQYGRGGRTLAPDGLWKENGCGHGPRRPAEEEALDTGSGISGCVKLIQIVESFNAYVGAWCAGVPDLWREHCEYEDQAEREAKQARAQRKARETRERNYWNARGVVTQGATA